VAYVRAGNGPYFIELKTYRFRAHSMFDPDLYRSKAEVEAWKHRCPIEAFKTRAREAGLIADAEIAAIEADTAREIQDALAFAEAGTLEPVENLTRDVYARERRVVKAGAS
jgi:TPP-dependent pyruvate/acetoin dehydrogenase alpha subunit